MTAASGVRYVHQPEQTREYKKLRRWGLFEGNIFGPVESRRFGRSLGINPLPQNEKVCTFDCVYCECGRTVKKLSRLLCLSFPTVAALEVELRVALDALKKSPPDALTVTGNGEPTLHPDFDRLMRMITKLRKELAPKAVINVLTNGTTIGSPKVRAGLKRADTVMMKLDAGSSSTMKEVDVPLVAWNPTRAVAAARLLDKVVIQALFVTGAVDNTGEENLEKWLKCLKMVRPEKVLMYTLDRVPPTAGLKRVSPAFLRRVGKKLEKAGLTWEML